MIDERQYWEKFMTFGIFVFAIYPFTKDFVDEPILEGLRSTVAQILGSHIFGGFFTRSIAAYFLALFIAAIVVLVGERILSRRKKREIDDFKKNFY